MQGDRAAVRGRLIGFDGAAGRYPREGAPATRRFALLCVAALLLSCLALGRLADALDLRGDGMAAQKLWLARNLGHYDIVFLGTSHVVRGVIPDQVDAALAEAGCQGRSLNLGIGGGRLTELALLADRVAALMPDVVIVTEGSGAAEPWPREDRRLNDRRQTVGLGYLAAQYAVLKTQRTPPTSLLLFAGLALRRDLGHHALFQALFVRPVDTESERDRRLIRDRGYQAHADDPGTAPARQRFLGNLPRYRQPATLQQALARLQRLSRTAALPAQILVDSIRGGGARPVLLLLPAFSSYADVAARSALALDPTLPAIDLAIDRGILPWPDPDYFHDHNHVSARGAAIVSREIGRRLCLLLQAGRV